MRSSRRAIGDDCWDEVSKCFAKGVDFSRWKAAPVKSALRQTWEVDFLSVWNAAVAKSALRQTCWGFFFV